MHFSVVAALALCIPVSISGAQIVVPSGYSAQNISPLLDGVVPQLFAIDDPGYGVGVVGATVNNGVMTVRLIRPNGIITTLGVWNQAPLNATVLRVRLDDGDVIDGQIHITVYDDTNVDTYYLTVSESGVVSERWQRADNVGFDFVFSTGLAGNPLGVVLSDTQFASGTQLAWMNTSFGVQVQNLDSLPIDRTDLDVRGFQQDVTGLYGGGILLADSDGNNDDITVIYELRDVLSGGTYRAIGSTVSTTVRSYGDLAIAAGGDFGGVVYVTDRVTDEIQQVAPDGTHTTWATGFDTIDSLSISPDGSEMYVGDINGVWIIRDVGNEPGPVVLCQEPSVPASSVLTGGAVESLRLILNEPMSFVDEDVTITNSNGDPIGFDVSGSGSQFMLIGLATPLFGDTYTVTVADTAISAVTGEPLDGDGDGFSGGDAVLGFTHRCEADFTGDGSFDFFDVSAFLQAFGAGCP